MKVYKKKQTIERITLIGLNSKRKEQIDWCRDNGYTITHIGPKRISCYKCDTTKFHIVAEKEIA